MSQEVIARSIGDLGSVYLWQGDYAKARTYLLRALTRYETAAGQDQQSLVPLLNDLACVYRLRREFGRAQVLYERALTIMKASAPEHPTLASVLVNLAGIYYAQHKYSEAEPLLNRALSIKKKTLEPDDPSLVETLRQYSLLLRKLKRTAEAAAVQREITSVLAASR
jgi:tetratricopeptide (TPR) repeat protein